MRDRVPAVLALLAVLGSAAPGTGQTVPQSKSFEFLPGGLRGEGGGQALVYGVRNTSKKPQWGMVEFEHPNGDLLCEFVRRIEPGATVNFECPVTGVAAGDRYQLALALYETDRLTDRLIRFEPVLAITDEELARAGKDGGAAAEARELPAVLDEGAPTPFPASFEPTWYRRVERGFSLRAYENSGVLTVAADALVFTAGKKTVRIPVDRITSVRHDSLPRDIANHWVVVHFTNDEGKPDGVGFRDGARMGAGQDTTLMYLAVRRAAKP